MKRLLLWCVALILFATIQAQVPANGELLRQLEGKSRFTEVWDIVSRYYGSNNRLSSPAMAAEYKKWRRWAWWESKHLDEQGRFTNSTKRIFDEAKRIQNNTARTEGAQSNSGQWSLLGPQNLTSGIARVDRLAFDHTNTAVMYAGTPAAGLWKTTNSGNNWFPLHAFAPSLGVSGIVVDAQNANTLYVLTGDGDSYANAGFVYMRSSMGILKSTNGGTTWFKLSNILPENSAPFYGFKLVQLPDFNNVLFAATSQGLFRSTDFGQNWSRCGGTPINDIFDIEIKPGNSATVYASSRFGIYISNDYGQNFSYYGTFSTLPTNTTRRSALAVSPASPNALYVNFGGQTTTATESLLYQSLNSGTSFTLMNNTHEAATGYMCVLTASPQNANRVIHGAMNLSYSANSGASFSFGAGIHADMHDLAYNGGFLYAACDGGVYRSSDNGANWAYLSNELAATQYYHMTGTELNDNAVLGGTQDNGYIRRSNTGVFSLVGGGDGFSGKFLNNSDNVFILSINAGVFKYTNSTGQLAALFNAATSQQVNNLNLFFPALEVHPTNNNILYAGYIDSLRRSTDGGSTWTALPGSGSARFGFAGGLAVSANNPDRLYIANGNTLSISNNQGTTQTVISDNPGWPVITGNITDVCTRPTNANEVWVTFSGFSGPRVLYSSNAGATWVDFSGSLPNLPAYCIQYTASGDAYIGTDYGVYVMTFTMNDWAPFYNGLPNIPVTDLFVNETAGSIKAATFGRGVWQSDLYTGCGVQLFPLTGAVQGRRFYQFSNTLQSAQQMDGNVGNELRFRSPEKIRLTNGFRAAAGSYLRAVIGPCGQGVFEKSDDGGSAITKAAALALQ
jgi:hypothetical protein